MTEEKQPEEMNVKAEAQVQETKAQPDEDVVLQQGEEKVKADASSQEQNVGQEEAQAKEEDPQVTIAALKSQLEVLAKQALSDKEKMMRAVAEADNSRKRAEADVERERKYALEKFVKALIPVVDSLDMALEALKGPSREQVERMRGEWKAVPRIGVYDTICSKCGYAPGIRFFSSDFCPHCGAPITDEAVGMMLGRWKETVNGEQAH